MPACDLVPTRSQYKILYASHTFPTYCACPAHLFVVKLIIQIQGKRYRPIEMWWHTRRNQISSYARNGRVHLNRPGGGGRGGRRFSRLLAAGVCASAVVVLDTPCSEVVWRVLATNSIRQFPLHFPSLASPCAITYQLESTRKGAPIYGFFFLQTSFPST
jgi:hypothetical protein